MSSTLAAALDTNVLLLRLVSQTDPSLLRTFKRVESFTEADMEALDSLLGDFRAFISTPHVLAETSNFVDQAPPYRREALTDAYRAFTDAHGEHYERARDLVLAEHFPSLGLTDTGLVSLSHHAVVITVDWQLAGQIQAQGGRVVNFNYLRHLVS